MRFLHLKALEIRPQSIWGRLRSKPWGAMGGMDQAMGAVGAVFAAGTEPGRPLWTPVVAATLMLSAASLVSSLRHLITFKLMSRTGGEISSPSTKPLWDHPTNIASVNLVMGSSKLFFSLF